MSYQGLHYSGASPSRNTEGQTVDIEVHGHLLTGLPQFRADIDRDTATRVWFTPGEISRTAAAG